MSIFLSLVFALVFAVSCENSNVKEEPKKEEFRPLIVRKDGQYIEYYPGHKQIKMKGREDADGNRAGIWKLFSKMGLSCPLQFIQKEKKMVT